MDGAPGTTGGNEKQVLRLRSAPLRMTGVWKQRRRGTGRAGDCRYSTHLQRARMEGAPGTTGGNEKQVLRLRFAPLRMTGVWKQRRRGTGRVGDCSYSTHPQRARMDGAPGKQAETRSRSFDFAPLRMTGVWKQRRRGTGRAGDCRYPTHPQRARMEGAPGLLLRVMY